MQSNTISNNSSSSTARRYDIDTLRVLAFSLLIFYHIGMFYVANWGFHVKSEYRSEWLENMMLLVNPWRLALLFLISGLAMRLALEKLSVIELIGKRHLRLLLPLAFGVLVIIPPQLYYEMTQNGDLQMSYWQFYRAFFDLSHPIFENYQAGILPHMDVNHLWYIRELWIFTVYLLLLMPILHSDPISNALEWLGTRGGYIGLLLLPLVPLVLLSVLVETDTESYRKALGFSFLIYGYLLGRHIELWEQIKRCRRAMLVVALVSYVILVALYNLVWLNENVTLSTTSEWLVLIFRAINRWSWVVAILGFAAVYLDKPNRLIRYLNEAVYPYYILHQTIIVVAGYELTQWQLGPILEPLLLIMATLVGCAALYEYVIRRVAILRPLFGLKN